MKNISKFFSIILVVYIFLNPTLGYASAWVNDKGKSTFTTSFGYIPTYKSYASNQVEDDLANISDYSVLSKTNYISLGGLMEYGITSDTTLIGDIQSSYYNDKLIVSNSLNGAQTKFLFLKSRYHIINSNFGFKQKIYGDENSYDILSYQILFYPGDLIIKDKSNYLNKKLAGKLSFLYGYSFDIPFGTDDRPSYENFIDLELGYKGYPRAGKSEGIANVEIGLKPFGVNPLIIIGFLNTFNEYNFTKRPFNQNAINSGIDEFGVTPQIGNTIKSDIDSNLTQQANEPYHQINFQLGFSLDQNNMVYLQSFHNIIKNKPFTYNSYYLSFEYKF